MQRLQLVYLPALRRISTTFACPLSAALCKGVSPPVYEEASVKLGSAPSANSLCRQISTRIRVSREQSMWHRPQQSIDKHFGSVDCVRDAEVSSCCWIASGGPGRTNFTCSSRQAAIRTLWWCTAVLIARDFHHSTFALVASPFSAADKSLLFNFLLFPATTDMLIRDPHATLIPPKLVHSEQNHAWSCRMPLYAVTSHTPKSLWFADLHPDNLPV